MDGQALLEVMVSGLDGDMQVGDEWGVEWGIGFVSSLTHSLTHSLAHIDGLTYLTLWFQR
jgi:hypothetical protein